MSNNPASGGIAGRSQSGFDRAIQWFVQSYLSRSLAALSLLMLPLGLLVLLTGAASLADAEDINAQVQALTFAIGGLVILLGVGATAGDYSTGWRNASVTAASAAGVALSAYLAITQLTLWTHVFLFPVWLVLLVASATVFALHRKAVADVVETAKSAKTEDLAATWIARLSSVGISAGLAFNLVQVAYAHAYSTSTTRSYSLTIQSSLADDGVDAANKSLHMFSATFSIKNPSTSEVQIARSVYAVIGYEFAGAPASEFRDRINASDINQDTSSRDLVTAAGHLVQFGAALLPFSMLEPSQQIDRRISFAVPTLQASAFSALSLQIIVITTGPHLQVADTSSEYQTSAPCAEPDKCTFKFAWPIRPQNTAWKVTTGSQVFGVIESINFAGANQGVSLTPCIQEAQDVREVRDVCQSGVAAGMLRFYGLGMSIETADLSMVGR